MGEIVLFFFLLSNDLESLSDPGSLVSAPLSGLTRVAGVKTDLGNLQDELLLMQRINQSTKSTKRTR